MVFSFVGLYLFGSGHATVDQSIRKPTPSEAPSDITLNGSFPASASGIQYARSSVGMGGRFLSYRFSAPLSDLRSHAQAEFDSHWEKLTPTISRKKSPPFDESWLRHLEDAYGVQLDWLNPSKIGSGVKYLDKHGSNRPIIDIDEDNNSLYFVMTD